MLSRTYALAVVRLHVFVQHTSDLVIPPQNMLGKFDDVIASQQDADHVVRSQYCMCFVQKNKAFSTKAF